MEEEQTLENVINSQHQANMALLDELEPVAFEKYDFEHDTILQRLPSGMRPTDSIESHKARCQEEMTENHQFASRELAEKFISVRFADYVLKEETKEHRFYICPHGQHETCTGYAKLFLNFDSHIVRACFGHYGHDTSVGQYRFTGIQFATIRLYCDFYWRKTVGPEWNVHNIVYCFKHWYDDTHILHFMSIYDIRAIAVEIGREDAAAVKLPSGVYHSVRITSMEDMSKYVQNGQNKTQTGPINDMDTPVSLADSNGEGTSGPSQALVDEAVTSPDLPTPPPETSSSSQGPSESPLTEWCLDETHFQLISTMWLNIHHYATKLGDIAYHRGVVSDFLTQDYNDAHQICEMLKQASGIARTMHERMAECNGQTCEIAVLEPPLSSFSVNINDPFFRNLYPLQMDNQLYPVPLSPFNKQDGAENSNNPSPAQEDDDDGPGVEVEGTAYPSPQVNSLLHQIWMNRNPTIESSYQMLREQDFQRYEYHRAHNKNIWAMPLPSSTYISSRLYRATGINLKKKMEEMREKERQIFEREIQAGMKEIDEKMAEANALLDNGRNGEVECDSPVEEVHISKNKKKKNKKKEKMRLAAEAAVKAAAAEAVKKLAERPLRHLNK